MIRGGARCCYDDSTTIDWSHTLTRWRMLCAGGSMERHDAERLPRPTVQWRALRVTPCIMHPSLTPRARQSGDGSGPGRCSQLVYCRGVKIAVAEHE